MPKLTAEERKLLLNGSSEPTIEPDNYTGSLCRALNYYNVEADSKKKRKYAETYAKKVLNIDVSAAPDYMLNTMGALCRLIERQEPISDFDKARLHDGLTAIANSRVLTAVKNEKAIKAAEKVQQKPKKSPEQIAAELSDPIIEEIEYAIDELILKDGGGGSDFNVKSISINNPKAAKIVAEFCEKRLAEYEEAKLGECEQLKEGYSNIGRRKINHLVVLMTELIQRVKQSAATSKVRKPKPRKVKPAHVLVSKMKYCKEITELGLTSVDPKEIVGATEVVVFNTKYRRLTIIRALEDNPLSVKGSTIVNIDPTTSVCKTLRKPEEQLKQFVKQTKRNTAMIFKTIKSVERAANGRMNEESIIISVNK